jgi:hypothetical protein
MPTDCPKGCRQEMNDALTLQKVSIGKSVTRTRVKVRYQSDALSCQTLER